jgi:hypothetical protein
MANKEECNTTECLILSLLQADINEKMEMVTCHESYMQQDYANHKLTRTSISK